MEWSNASSNCFSQSNSLRAFPISRSLSHAESSPLETSAASAAILEAITPSLTSSREGKDKCSAGCIGCKKCEKSCPVGAITVENNLATIDYSKCVGCKVCADVCPKKVIKADLSDRRKVSIDESKCIGCTACARTCPFGAIEGEKKQPHKVDLEKCKGCHLCMKKCKKDAIKLVDSKEESKLAN